MTRRGFLGVAVAALVLCAAGVSSSWAQHSVLARTDASPYQAARPALGDLTIRPKIVRVGQILTISGVTNGFVQFLPPFVVINSLRKHTVHRDIGLCSGTHLEPVATYSRPGGGAGGPGTRKQPPPGSAWKVRIRIPTRMFSSTPNGRSTRIVTPSGRYEIGATGVGLDFCTLPRASGAGFSVGYFRIGGR